ncbi:MAG: hypothetical protein JW820_19390, partial [Spirochaetales bacterium]|nr:hypothetical protein [Spirochaetales bacterium]
MLERLIGFLPIILLFVVPALIGLRRAVRRRRVQGEAPEESGAQEGSPGRPGTKPSVPAAQGPVPRQPARAAAAEIRARPTRAPRPAGAAAAAQVQEQYVYPSPLSLHRLPAAAETSQAVRATAARAAQAAA